MKKQNQQNIPLDDVELSDPELREIENMKSEDEFGKSENSESIDLEELENDINAMEEEQPRNLPKAVPQKAPSQSKNIHPNIKKENPALILQDIEKEFHGPELMFGEILEQEIDVVLPDLKSKYERDEENIDYFLMLTKKEMELVKFRMTIMSKVKKGEIDEQKYLTILEKIIDKNKITLQSAKAKSIPPQDIKRINKRIETGWQELKSIKEAPSEEPVQEERQKETAKDETQGPTTEEQTSKIAKPEDTEPQIKHVENEKPKQSIENASSPVLIHFAQKISFFMCFLDYLKKHFPSDRASDIKTLQDQINAMKEELQQLKIDPTKKSIEDIDQEFPSLQPKFIIGMDRIERNKKIEGIINDIQADIKQLKSAPLLEQYKNHYTPIIGKLIQVRDSPFSPMPVVSKKPFPIPTTDVNKNIQSGEMIIKIFKIRNVPPKRYFYVNYEFKYQDTEFKDVTPYCDGIGLFNYQKKYLLDSSRINKRFPNEKITFTLCKKKYIISSRFVSTATLSLEKLKNYMDYKTTLEFEYKNNTKVYLDIEISIFKALEKPLKDIYLYIIEKQIPPFSLIHDKKDNKQIPSEQPKKDLVVAPPKTEDLKVESTNTKSQDNKSSVSKGETSQKSHKQEEEDLKALESATFKFPILKAQQKKALAALVAKNNLPKIYLDYQDKIFCVTFLEELLKELDQQINQFAINGDSETRKEAEEIMMNATKYSNYLNSKLESGDMSTADYKSKVDNFIKLDETNLPFFEKINFHDSVTYIKNRLEIMRGESAQLAEILKEQE